jgi:hypothetical protein
MELFCSLLTGFFLWLLVFQWRHKSVARLHAMTGRIEYSVKTIRSSQWHWILLVFFLFSLISNIVTALRSSYIPLESHFGFTLLFALVLLIGVPAGVKNVLEVYEKGILSGECGIFSSLGRLLFVPWNQVAKCQWVPYGFEHMAFIHQAHKCLTIPEDSIAPEHKTDVTASIGRFVPVYDVDGDLLAKPDQEQNAIRVPWQSLEGLRFRFDRQTTLLLVVVVACILWIFGLYYYSPHYQALVKLEAFQPRVFSRANDDVWSLDFSSCTNKPTDDDLVNLEPLRELIDLNLSGCPITDAGLEHLKGLQQLHMVNLANTDVTSKGMEELRQALPKSSIGEWIKVTSEDDAKPSAKDHNRH